MVALKPLDSDPASKLFRLKQERRGGIETEALRRGRGSGGPKQERRGGIETTQERSMTLLRKRSRNAVVALKPGTSSARGPWRSSKQERRGGIETEESNRLLLLLSKRSRNAVVALKREADLREMLRWFREAGTPWWH